MDRFARQTIRTRLSPMHVAIAVLAAANCCASALGDGGTLRTSKQHGRYHVSVFTSPTPLRAGPVDVSVLIQDSETSQVISGAQVFVTLTPVDASDAPLFAVATEEAATNKLLRAAIVEIPRAGEWDIQVSCVVNNGRLSEKGDRHPTSSGSMTLHPPHTGASPLLRIACGTLTDTFIASVAPPLARWLTVWPWFGWPVVPIALFAVHRRIVARSGPIHRGRSNHG